MYFKVLLARYLATAGYIRKYVELPVFLFYYYPCLIITGKYNPYLEKLSLFDLHMKKVNAGCNDLTS